MSKAIFYNVFKYSENIKYVSEFLVYQYTLKINPVPVLAKVNFYKIFSV